jgi:hypothetical protein
MPTTPRDLLTGIIDYAGLFPPAKLPMAEAFTRFLGHRAGDDGWLLAQFVCPASRLEELTSVIESAESVETPIRIAVLGAGGDDPPGFAESMERDIAAMISFGNRHRDAAPVDVFEVKFPAQGEPASVVDYVHDGFIGKLSHPVTTFFEVSLLGEWQTRLTSSVDAISAASQEIDRSRWAGLKIRCGGLDASAIPTVEAVADAVIAARDANLPLKATQGLHHPFRHRDESLGATVHGFLNLTAAAILAGSHDLDDHTIREILADEDPGSFKVTDTAISWRDIETPMKIAVEGRKTAITGFGSCSFSEPRDDLSSLGLL